MDGLGWEHVRADASDRSVSASGATLGRAAGSSPNRRLSMRKSIILIIALTIYGFLLGEGWAAKISIGGTHSRSEIQATCGAVGGSFFSNSHYGCTNECGADTCAVECVNGKCTGSCPRCGQRASPRSPPPRLSGADAVTRVLKNSVGRAK